MFDSSKPHCRVLMVSPFYYPDMGGISNHVHNISKNLGRYGDYITIVCPKRKGTASHSNVNDQIELNRISSVYMRGWPYPTLRSLSFPIRGKKEIDAVISSFNPNIIHVHGHHYPISWLALECAQKHGIPSVLTLHGMYALNPKKLGGKSLLEELFNKTIFPRILRRADAVVGLSDSISAYAANIKKDSSNFVTIGNGVNTMNFTNNSDKKSEYRRKYGIKEQSRVILFRGRLEQVKGIIEFSIAIKNLLKESSDNLEVVIVGEGSLSRDVRLLFRDIDKVHIYDWQPVESIHELYLSSDIFVLPSKFEALPITVIEAMNASLYVVFTAVGGVADILRGYSAKTCLATGSSDEIKDVLKGVVNNITNLTPDRYSMLYARKFDWNAVVWRLRELYLTLIRC